MGENKYIIKAADECLNIILLLAAPEYLQLTEQEIMKSLGLSKDRTYRMLRTLESKEFVKKANGKWAMAPAIVKIADGFRRHLAKKRAEEEELELEFLGEQQLPAQN
ncbi:MAG: hypothetical protein KAV87_53650 [Desulfobacteraceae bacterium]|nr:hypothetical protein [Desulfobacteraceae bacterium]